MVDVGRMYNCASIQLLQCIGAIDGPPFLIGKEDNYKIGFAGASSTSIRSIFAQSKYKILQNPTIRDIILITNSPIRLLLQGGLLGIGQSLYSMESDLHTRTTSVLNCVM